MKAIATDPQVIHLATSTLPVLAFLIFWDGLNAVLSGVLRGSGQQAIGALVNGGCFFVAIPASYYLVFHTNWSVTHLVPGLVPCFDGWTRVAKCGQAVAALPRPAIRSLHMGPRAEGLPPYLPPVLLPWRAGSVQCAPRGMPAWRMRPAITLPRIHRCFAASLMQKATSNQNTGGNELLSAPSSPP